MGIACATPFTKISLPCLDKVRSLQPCIQFQMASFKYANAFFLDRPMYTGSPKYFSLYASLDMSRMACTAALDCGKQFLLNMIADFSWFIHCREHCSYICRIRCSFSASLSLGLLAQRAINPKPLASIRMTPSLRASSPCPAAVFCGCHSIRSSERAACLPTRWLTRLVPDRPGG